MVLVSDKKVSAQKDRFTSSVVSNNIDKMLQSIFS